MDHARSTVYALPARSATAETRPEVIEALLARCARRDEQAIADLYALVSPQLFGLLLRMLRSSALAEEALQDVMVRVWQRADQFVAYRGRAMTWLMSIARYRAIDLLRTQRQQIALDDAPDEALVDTNVTDFSESVSSQRSQRALDDCLSRLTTNQRKCIALAYVDGYSQDQIARAIESPLGTVKSWMRRGLSSLKRCLES